MSAAAHLYGPLFDYNKTMLASPGTNIIVHEKNQRHTGATWQIWVLIGASNTPLSLSEHLHHINRERSHRGHFDIPLTLLQCHTTPLRTYSSWPPTK
jgi:hypothetical protein